ncbi:hypothetical protein BHE74_00059406, partial [Ensete ventricosum]
MGEKAPVTCGRRRRAGAGDPWATTARYRYADRPLPGSSAKNQSSAIDFGRRRSISAVGGRLKKKSTIGDRFEREIDRRRSIEEEKGKKKRKRKKKEKKEYLARAPSLPACRRRPRVAYAPSPPADRPRPWPLFLPREETERLPARGERSRR